MAKTQYLTYYVNIPDKALAESLVAQYPNGVNRAPTGMAIEAANIMVAAGVSTPNPLPILSLDDSLTAFVTPSLHSMWFTASSTFPRDVATFTQSTGWWIFGSSTKFYWIARFQYVPAAPAATGVENGTAGAGDVTRTALMPPRHWLDGMEIHDNGELATTQGHGMSRAGATLSEGFGVTFAGITTSSYRSHAYASANVKTKAWTRFYTRVKRLPLVSTEIAAIWNFAQNGSGLRLYITADGKLAVYTSTGSAVDLVSVYTGKPFTIGKRQRIDIVAYIGPNAANNAVEGTYAIFFDGGYVGTFTHAPGGLVGNGKISEYRIGRSSTATSELEIDFDDWRTSDWPADKDFKQPIYTSTAPGVGPFVAGDLLRYDGPRPAGVPMPAIGFEMFRATTDHVQGSSPRSDDTAHPPFKMNGGWEKVTDSADWLAGSRIVRLHNVGGTPASGWTGDYRLASIPLQITAPGGGLTSTTSAAVLPLATDAVNRLKNIRGVQGWAAVQVGCQSKKTAAALDGSVGYKIGAAAAVYAAITPESTTGVWSTALYSPSTLAAPEAIVAVEAHYKKGADANSSAVFTLLAEAEIIGNFSACDVEAVGGDATSAPALPRGLHNAPYPDTPWFGGNTAPPLAPVVIKAGTYVGNGTGQSLTFKAPVHWMWIRPLSGDTGGARFYSSAPNVQKNVAIGAASGGFGLWARRDYSFVPAWPTDDQQMQFLVDIPGSDSQLNANGVTYQYVAFMDPGARFLLNGACLHENTQLPVTDALEGASFLPEWAWFWRLDISNSSTSELWSKGAGHAAAEASKIGTGTPVASAVSWAAGSLTFNSGLCDATTRDSLVYSLWRRADGNNDPNQAKVVCFGTYIGDAAASRTISIAPASGLRPLYVEVQPLNAAALHRDPSHTGTTSEGTTGTSNASTGITAGAIDSFSVGSTLNANGQTYNWFCILGSATAGNNGWSANGEFTPVASDSPVDSSYAPPPTEFEDTPAEPGDDSGGGATSLPEEPDFDNETALPGTDRFCAYFTQRVVNKALSHLGVDKQIADVINENSKEAILVRLHFKDAVDATLRDFDWPRATKYAELVLVDGSEDAPVNKDWTYAYRAPADMIKGRRLVSSEGRKFDANPITWRLGRDADGEVIFTNQETTSDDPVTLEYTVRLACPSYMLDAEFRVALEWRVAHALAMPLARDKDKQKEMLGTYLTLLPRATETAANEQQAEQGDGDPEWIAQR